MRGGRRVQVQFKEIDIDYKDLDALRQFIGETGKMYLAASPVRQLDSSAT